MRNENQHTIGQWARDAFGAHHVSPARQALRTLEECVELCCAAGCEVEDVVQTMADTIREKCGQPTGLHLVPEEAADVAICLNVLAEIMHFQLDGETDTKMTTNRARAWATNGDGTAQHVEGEYAPLDGAA